MGRETKAQKAEKAEAIERLREILQPGDTVHTILRHVSKSGMLRRISPVKVGVDGSVFHLDYLASKALGEKLSDNGDGIPMGGCGMDMGFALVYNLSATVFPAYQCVGPAEDGKRRCPSCDHLNPGPNRENYAAEHRDGYALRQAWL